MQFTENVNSCRRETRLSVDVTKFTRRQHPATGQGAQDLPCHFLSRVSTLARDIVWQFCLSVGLFVCHVPVLYQNGLTYRHKFFTTW